MNVHILFIKSSVPKAMIYFLPLVYILLFVASEALQISTARPYFRDGVFQVENSTEVYSKMIVNSPDVEVFTSGFERTDTYNSLTRQWIRAQVVPIGICFKEGNGSVIVAQMMMTSVYTLRVTHTYDASDCTGSYSTLLLRTPIVKFSNDFEHVVNFVAGLEAALESNSDFGDGLIISSYYSSKGCTGPVAQYDLVSADEYTGYDEPIGACGMFQCHSEAEMVVLTLFGTYDGNPFIHPYCRRDKSISEDNDDELYSGNDELSGYRSIKQPFQCTDVSVVGQKDEGFPHFQTVHCVEATYDLDSTDEEVGYADEVEERDPEFDLFYGPVKARNDATTPTDDEWYSN